MKIKSLNFDSKVKGNTELFKLLNDYAKLRPSHKPACLAREVLMDVLPMFIAKALSKT